jgi:hypothetical protein
VIEVSTAVEVDEWLQSNDGCNVLLGFGRGQLFRGGVVAVDIGLVVVLVVQLHDLAGNGRLECAVVIYIPLISKKSKSGRDREGRLTWQVGERSFAPDEACACDRGSSLCSSSSESGASYR